VSVNSFASIRFGWASVVLLSAFVGCNGSAGDPKKTASSYVSLKDAEDAFAAKKYGEAVPLLDAVIASGSVQADVLGETYLKRAICKLELGDKPGAREDLAKAEQGGAVGEDYQKALKRMSSD
jgi:hypothetical protein